MYNILSSPKKSGVRVGCNDVNGESVNIYTSFFSILVRVNRNSCFYKVEQ